MLLCFEGTLNGRWKEASIKSFQNSHGRVCLGAESGSPGREVHRTSFSRDCNSGTKMVQADTGYAIQCIHISLRLMNLGGFQCSRKHFWRALFFIGITPFQTVSSKHFFGRQKQETNECKKKKTLFIVVAVIAGKYTYVGQDIDRKRNPPLTDRFLQSGQSMLFEKGWKNSHRIFEQDCRTW